MIWDLIILAIAIMGTTALILMVVSILGFLIEEYILWGGFIKVSISMIFSILLRIWWKVILNVLSVVVLRMLVLIILRRWSRIIRCMVILVMWFCFVNLVIVGIIIMWVRMWILSLLLFFLSRSCIRRCIIWMLWFALSGIRLNVWRGSWSLYVRIDKVYILVRAYRKTRIQKYSVIYPK